ncbi:MAG: hypothetical protein Q9159_004120 [Coniocarpon cinnabarinum]
MASETIHEPEGTTSDQVVTPFKVSGKQDYTRLIKEFGTKAIDKALLERFERATGVKPHPLLRRGLFFSHRDFDRILSYYEKGEPFFLYTGRGPSTGSMHLGHTVPFDFTKFLQDAFDVPLVIMLTDDEKFLYRSNLKLEDTIEMAHENAKDIMAFGFDPKKTFIFSDFEYMSGHFYQNAVEFARLVPFNQVRGTFGFDNSTNIGFINFPAVQNAAAFASSYPMLFGDDAKPRNPRNPRTSKIPCLIPCAIDQDPYFRLLRDNAHRMSQPAPKPALIHAKFVTALRGPEGKMSASDATSAIFMTDTPKQIKDKINKYAFSGGRETLEEHREKGGDPDIDVAYNYLSYFLEDDAELAKLAADYRKGDLLTGELKKKCISVLTDYVTSFQGRRAAVTDQTSELYMAPRKMEFGGNPNPGYSHPLSSEIGQPNGAQAKDDDSEGAEAQDEATNLKPTRPGLGRKTTYGIRGLSSYGGAVTEMLYPTKSREPDAGKAEQ